MRATSINLSFKMKNIQPSIFHHRYLSKKMILPKIIMKRKNLIVKELWIFNVQCPMRKKLKVSLTSKQMW